MKKIIVLFASLFLITSTFACPDWDNPLQSVKAKFTDPYVTNYGAYIVGTWSAPNYAVQIQVNFNQSVSVPYYAIVQVLGKWDNAPGGASYREFTILFNPGQWHKAVNFPMSNTEEAYTTMIDLLDYGPQ